MPCYRPLNAWQKAKGAQPQFTPAPIKLQLSCGQCCGCRLEHSRQWAVRCIHEASLHNDNCFITLTYDDTCLPYGNSLVKGHFQKFMKRLRARSAPRKVRYFMCGEYGDELGRPHFHAILFGYDFRDKSLWTEKEGINLYVSDELDSLWRHGFATVGEATWETAAYVSRYVLKKRTGKAKESHYKRFVEETGEVIDLQPEYAAMSLKPAIAREWYEAYQSDCFPKDFVTHRGQKYRLPKYYDELLRRDDETALEQIKQKRKEQAFAWAFDNTKERLAAKEECTLARTKQLRRQLT